MGRAIVAGNWKMYGTRDTVSALLMALKEGVGEDAGCEVVIFPPFVYLPESQTILDGTPIQWGGQNMSANEPGAYTGEIAAQMLIEYGCKYVLVGHSERRSLYNEDDVLVAMKFAQAQHQGLTPILCVGESQGEREQGLTEQVIACQLDAVLNLDGGVGLLENAIVAYEPVWAIGTGLTATPEQAQEVHGFIRNKLAQLDERIAERLPLLYGGSVKGKNAAELFAMPDIDGGLVGGASLDAQDFLEIIQCNR